MWSAKKIYIDGLKDEGHKVRPILRAAKPGCGKSRVDKGRKVGSTHC